MPVKLFAAVVAVTLMLGFLASIVFKLREPSLGVVALIGVTMMIVDLRQSLRTGDEQSASPTDHRSES